MTTNPFVYLAESPVEFFALLGYALIMLFFVFLSLIFVARQTAEVYQSWSIRNKRADWWRWMDVIPVPPTLVILRAASVPFVLALTAWAIGALVYIVG